MKDFQISILVPLYNEEEVFPELIARLDKVIEKMPMSIEVVLVDDGSRDQTAMLMKEKAEKNPNYQCVFLSRNHGHQTALTAGFNFVRGTEAIMVIDGDLQDPPELLEELYAKFTEGYEVVYAIRRKRKEVWWKRLAYQVYYRLVVRLSKVKLPLDSGDFALISKRVVDIMNKMPEESRYLRGLRTWVGFKQTGIEYERHPRAAGEAKYDIKMLFRLAYNGIFNFSTSPITFISYLGFFSVLLSFFYFLFVLYLRVFTEVVPSGFTALVFLIILFGGVQLLSIGIIGEYLIRVFFQTKNRPLFLVDRYIINQEEKVYDN